nr:PTS glucose transporter subunit IIA [Listeria ivanovii]
MMGVGFAVRPTTGTLFSPIAGTVESIFPMNHAITLKSVPGIDVLVHIGLETVELGGAGILLEVKKGDR